MSEAMTRYDALVKKHGTLQDFESAVWNAANTLMITDEEALRAVREYQRELADARLADMADKEQTQ